MNSLHCTTISMCFVASALTSYAGPSLECGGLSVTVVDYDSCLCVTKYDLSAGVAGIILCDQGTGTTLGSETDAVAALGENCLGGGEARIARNANCYDNNGHQDCADCTLTLNADAFFASSPTAGMSRVVAGAVIQSNCPGTVCQCGYVIESTTAAARAIAKFTLDPKNCTEGLHQIAFSGTIALPAVPSANSRGLYLLSTGDGDQSRAIWFIDAMEGWEGYGVGLAVAPSGERSGVISLSYQIASITQIDSAVAVRYSDIGLDSDGNGRFNERDWNMIQGLLGSTDAADLAKYNVYIEDDADSDGDFEDDQIISQEDLDIIRSLLDTGLGAGEFGDYDGNGIVDCSDLNAAPSSFSAVLGDANYLVTLDSDLDGDNDAVDRAAFDALFPTADLAAPFGVLDLADLVAFQTGMINSERASDFAPQYGVWDLADITAFTSAFGSPCP